MFRLLKSAISNRPPHQGRLETIRLHMAEAMIGRTVQLLSIGRITHGVVAAVFLEEQVPKLVVNGSKYDLSQILTVTPTSFNS